MNLMQVEDLRI